jgi:hypothetical protein
VNARSLLALMLAAVVAVVAQAPAQDAPAAEGAAPNLAVEVPPAAQVPVAQAIEEAVRFLVEHQNKDGSWGQYTTSRPWEIMADVPGSHHAFKAATTALCWMGLRDQQARTPESDEASARALGWLVENARVKRANGVEMYNVWAFGYGVRALTQALRTGAPGATLEAVRAAAEEIVRTLAKYQTPDGGWGYYDFNAQTFPPSDSSMSFTTATILIGLNEAREAGIDVPQVMIDKATRSVRACRKKDGSYIYGTYLQYVPRMGVNQPKGSSMRTPACHLALRLFGDDVSDDDLRVALDTLERHHRFAIAGVRRPIPHESWYQVSGYFYLYGHQYAALCLERLPEADQRRYWPFLAGAILKTRQPDGSFWDYPMYGFHKYYGTGYALISLGRCPTDVAPRFGTPAE